MLNSSMSLPDASFESVGWVRGVQDSPEAAALRISAGNKMFLENLAHMFCPKIKLCPIPDRTGQRWR